MTDKSKKSSIAKSADTKSFAAKSSAAGRKNIKSSSNHKKSGNGLGSRNRKGPKVSFDKKSVFLVSGAIVLACALVLFVSSLVQTGKLLRTVAPIEVTEDSPVENDVWQALSPEDAEDGFVQSNSVGPEEIVQNESEKKSDEIIKEKSEKKEDVSHERKSGQVREDKFVPEANKNSSAENNVKKYDEDGTKKESGYVKKSDENRERNPETKLNEFQKNVAENASVFSNGTSVSKNGDKLGHGKKNQESPNSQSTHVDKKSAETSPDVDKRNESPSEKYRIPATKNNPSLVFVIDDGGLHPENVIKYARLPFPITIAVLPKLARSRECADAVRYYGKELILHQPMQAKNLAINPGAGSLQPDMSTSQIAALIKSNLDDLGPGVRGMNNHEGSLITEDLIKMEGIYFVCQERNIYFLDSRTSAQSAARQASLEVGNRIYERNAPFLDNAVTKDDMLNEIYKGLEVANKNGFAIIIGHVDKSADILPDLLLDMYPELIRKGYRFATPSTLP